MDRFAGFGTEIATAVRGQHYEMAVIEHFWCAPYLEQAAAVSEATILDLHNVESVLHGRCALHERGAQAMAHRAFQRFCRAAEEHWLPRFTYLLAASSADADQLQNISPRSHILVYPNSIPLAPPALNRHEEAIVFSGNLEYHPNIAAVRFFYEKIWPALRERWPRLVWRLVGKNPEAVAGITRSDQRIELTGPVQNAVAELSRAKVAIVPVLAGSGTRVKILEAWAAGLPVVSTRLGAEGLPACDGKHLLLADNAVSFQRAVSRLLWDPELCDRIGQAGRSLYECDFTWEAAWTKLHFLYPATMERS
jgi:glycosyltransferase involved in cell wall biosynthesis